MSTVHRFTGDQVSGDFAWDGVTPREYNNENVQGVLKHVLVGPEDEAPNFIIRYFHVPVGQNTVYDQHPHEHGVVILHGQARVQINDSFHELGPLDALFISGEDIHQFTNIGETPMGFICVIQRRD
jgi:quercetin dioxygenase-like cupin family protein